MSQEIDTRGSDVYTHLEQHTKFRVGQDYMASSEAVTYDEEKCPFLLSRYTGSVT